VYGELLTFDDPETRLPALDHLEGFLPGWPSLYRRVLIPVKLDGAAFPAWLYAAQPSRSDLRLLPFGSWPS
jgi:gamma-glutamylcyclotransferase (GGCT)/AIG2-like uncharacterized protein YtfP